MLPNHNSTTPIVSLQAANRLEPRPRTNNFDRSLRAEVRDALWMLTRQWQWGEFKGEDTGSSVFAKTHLESSKITRYSLGGNPQYNGYSDSINPLESVVEQHPVFLDAYTGVLIGQRWKKMLKQNGLDTLYANYLTLYSFDIPTVKDESSASFFTNIPANQFQNAASARCIDGRKLYKKIKSGIAASNGIGTSVSQLDTLGTQLVSWFDTMYVQPDTGTNPAWHPSHLEYQFGCAIPEKIAATPTVLTAKEYYSGKMDWYSFDIASANTPVASNLRDAATTQEKALVTQTKSTMIPTGIKFPGMPNSRWWEFEDAHVDIGNIKVNDTDTSKIMLTEFGLVYGNDWNLISYPVPVGSLSRVKSIVVTDVFGIKTYVEPAGKGVDNNWRRWNMFNLNTRDENEGQLADNRLFIPPVISKNMESAPVEQVNFIRDEMANMVWAIETIIPDNLGGGRQGHEASFELLTYLKNLANATPAAPLAELDGVDIAYKLSTYNIPENWIPFIPAKMPSGSGRDIQLQRASLLRIIKGLYQNGNYPKIRPKTELLRKGIDSQDIQTASYYIHEEEIPRAGTILKTTYQRARWYNGKIALWLGRRKQTGRGEGASGLLFDQVVSKQKEE